MSHRALALLFCLPLLAMGCDDENSAADPVTGPTRDAASLDTGGIPITDQGVDPDDGVERDRGVDPDDGVERDQGVDPDDGVDPDQGVDPDMGPPSCDPIPGDLLLNGGFEDWPDLPTDWRGESTNLSTAAMESAIGVGRCGSNAARLINSDDSHRRLSTAPRVMSAGRYTLVYYAMGQGEIRNARYDGDYSSYSGYTQVDTLDWQRIVYTFNVAEDVGAHEVIFSLQNTVGGIHLLVDDASLVREAHICDDVVCPDWAECDGQSGECEARAGLCGEAADCRDWETCEANVCELAEGRCAAMGDCDPAGAAPLCDFASHTCVAGDPCADVECNDWEACDPDIGRCLLAEGRCRTTRDCTGAEPACDPETRTCVSAEHPANIFPNGGFEDWAVYAVPYMGENLLPLSWYGVEFPDATAESELRPEHMTQVEPGRSGLYALRIDTEGNAERITSDLFDIPPGAHTCAYWSRGGGNLQHRSYSRAGWSVATDRFEVGDEWTQTVIPVDGNMGDFRLIFYASFTDAAQGHVQIDDVVCTRNP